jgi:hypothetical protein
VIQGKASSSTPEYGFICPMIIDDTNVYSACVETVRKLESEIGKLGLE